jgi:hypothetical protein
MMANDIFKNEKEIFMKKVLFILTLIVSLTGSCYAENIALDVRSGYGILKFNENENFLGDKFKSDFKHEAILLGLSGEYSFPKHDNLYAGMNADWTFGLKDRETWDRNDIRVQTNDMKVFMQFYDLNFGYKDSKDNFHYKFYVSGGWDGLRFKRDKIVWQGTPISDNSVEDISLWKIGAGTGIGYKMDKWSLDGNIAYSYYLDGETEDSSLPDTTFDTKGTRLNIDFGVTRDITKNISIYLGGNYTLQKLKGDASDTDILWKSKLEILTGVVKIAYAF